MWIIVINFVTNLHGVDKGSRDVYDVILTGEFVILIDVAMASSYDGGNADGEGGGGGAVAIGLDDDISDSCFSISLNY